MQDHVTSTPAERAAYRRGQRAGLALAGLGIAVMAFISLLGVEKSLLALVIAAVALRGAGADRTTQRRAWLAIGLALVHWIVLGTVVTLFHQQLAQLIALLQRLS